MNNKVKEFMDYVIARNPGEKEFHQAVMEVAEKLLKKAEHGFLYFYKHFTM